MCAFNMCPELEVDTVLEGPPEASVGWWCQGRGWDVEGVAPTPVVLPGESQGQRSLVGSGPRGHKHWAQLSA